MKDDLNRKTTLIKDDLHERRPQWKMTSMEDNIKGTQPQWKRLLQWKTTSIKEEDELVLITFELKAKQQLIIQLFR